MVAACASGSRAHARSRTMGRRILSEQRVVFVALLLIVGAAKWPVLSTPYHWDETLWIGFAHTLSGMPLWRVLPGLQPPSTFGGRPPGLFLPMAALFKMFGPSIW